MATSTRSPFASCLVLACLPGVSSLSSLRLVLACLLFVSSFRLFLASRPRLSSFRLFLSSLPRVSSSLAILASLPRGSSSRLVLASRSSLAGFACVQRCLQRPSLLLARSCSSPSRSLAP